MRIAQCKCIVHSAQYIKQRSQNQNEYYALQDIVQYTGKLLGVQGRLQSGQVSALLDTSPSHPNGVMNHHNLWWWWSLFTGSLSDCFWWCIQNMLLRLQYLIWSCGQQNIFLGGFQIWWRVPHIGIPLPPVMTLAKKGLVKMVDKVQLDQTLIKKTTATFVAQNCDKSQRYKTTGNFE